MNDSNPSFFTGSLLHEASELSALFLPGEGMTVIKKKFIGTRPAYVLSISRNGQKTG